MFSEVAEIALVAARLGQFQRLLKTRVILILNFTRLHEITYTNFTPICNISNNGKFLYYHLQGRVFQQIPNTEKWVEKTRRGRIFSKNFEVFGYLMKHGGASQCINNCSKIQRKSSPNFMIIRITHPNLFHVMIFFIFILRNLGFKLSSLFHHN